jgi:CP family cyanate transporter-like MFS transporter
MPTIGNGRNMAPAKEAERRQSIGAFLLRHPAWSVAAIALIAVNLRPVITSIAPFIGAIRQDLGLTGIGISALTTAPVICLGLFGPVAPPLARRFGAEAVMLASLLGLVAGIVVRSFGTVPLFLGTVIIGAALSLLGVLSPVIVKRDFPQRVGTMVGLYTMLICLGAALSTATAVPLATLFGGRWQLALLFWAAPALLAAIVFIPQLFRPQGAGGGTTARRRGVTRDPLAWQVTGFFALVASLAYAVFNWGPSMLQGRGIGATESGVIVSLSYVAQMATALAVPMVAGGRRDQRALVVLVVGLTIAGLLGFIFAPVWSLTGFSVVLGLGQGGAFGLSLSLIVLRAGDAEVAAELSSLVQSVGYVAGGLAGPFAVGLIHDWSSSWPTVAIFYVAIGLASLALGLGAGRDRIVKTESAR